MNRNIIITAIAALGLAAATVPASAFPFGMPHFDRSTQRIEVNQRGVGNYAEPTQILKTSRHDENSGGQTVEINQRGWYNTAVTFQMGSSQSIDIRQGGAGNTVVATQISGSGRH